SLVHDAHSPGTEKTDEAKAVGAAKDRGLDRSTSARHVFALCRWRIRCRRGVGHQALSRTERLRQRGHKAEAPRAAIEVHLDGLDFPAHQRAANEIDRFIF